MNGKFSKEEMQMAPTYMGKCPSLLAFSETQIKVTIRYKKKSQITYAIEDAEKMSSYTLLVGIEIGTK